MHGLPAHVSAISGEQYDHSGGILLKCCRHGVPRLLIRQSKKHRGKRIEEAAALCVAHRGVCWPAHIDRPANGILAVLGAFPDDPPFGIAELNDPDTRETLCAQHSNLNDLMFVSGSDAHYLWDIREKCCSLEIDDEPYSSELVRRRLFEQLRAAAAAMEGYR